MGNQSKLSLFKQTQQNQSKTSYKGRAETAGIEFNSVTNVYFGCRMH